MLCHDKTHYFPLNILIYSLCTNCGYIIVLIIGINYQTYNKIWKGQRSSSQIIHVEEKADSTRPQLLCIKQRNRRSIAITAAVCVHLACEKSTDSDRVVIPYKAITCRFTHPCGIITGSLLVAYWWEISWICDGG